MSSQAESDSIKQFGSDLDLSCENNSSGEVVGPAILEKIRAELVIIQSAIKKVSNDIPELA